MEKRFVLQSNVDGLPIHGWAIQPTGEIKGVVQMMHGMREFKERYESLMRMFAENGYVAVCYDQRGHGDSVRNKEDRGYFYDKTGNAIVKDAVQVTQWIKTEYPNLPVALLGHSMGSMVVRCYLREHDDLVDKAIICGSPKENSLCNVGIFLARLISALRGGRHRSKFLVYISTGSAGEKFASEGEGGWLGHDRENIESYCNHPQRSKVFTCNGYLNLFRLLKMTYDKKGYKVKNPDLKILFLSGGDDVVLGSEEKFLNVVNFMREVGYTHVDGKMYEGMRHEIFHDYGKEKVYEDFVNFLKTE